MNRDVPVYRVMCRYTTRCARIQRDVPVYNVMCRYTAWCAGIQRQIWNVGVTVWSRDKWYVCIASYGIRGTSPSIRSCTSHQYLFFLLQCMVQTWYIAADAQIYLLSPVLLFPLQYWPRFGLGLTFAALIAAFFTSFGISYVTEDHVDCFRDETPE